MKKKNKSDKKISREKQKKLLTIIPISIILLVMLVFLIGYLMGVSTNKKTILQEIPTISDDKNISKPEISVNQETINQNDDAFELTKEIYFLQDKEGKKIISESLDKNMTYLGKYTCEYVGCGIFPYIPSPRNEHQFLENNLVLIYESDGNKEYTNVYNYQTNKVDATYGTSLCSYQFSNGTFSILINDNDKLGILNSKGKLIYKTELDKWDYFADAQVCSKIAAYDEITRSSGYNITNGVFKKNNKYGVINIKTGEVILDFKYQGLRLMYDGNYSIKENNKWYLINNKLEKIINIGYDEIYSFNDVILVGTNQSNNIVEYQLIDPEGNILTNSVKVKSFNISEYYQVKSGSIKLGNLDGGTFRYDLSAKKLEFKSEY